MWCFVSCLLFFIHVNFFCADSTTGVIQTLQAFIMYTNTDYNIHGAIPLLFISPCWFPFAPFSSPLYLLGTLLAVTGSVHLGLSLLANWPPLSQPFPQSLPSPNSQNPGYQAPHYDDLKNPASSVRNTIHWCNFRANLNWWDGLWKPMVGK